MGVTSRGVPPPIGCPVKGGLAFLVLPGWNDAAQVMPPHPGANAGVTVALVSADATRPRPALGSTRPFRPQHDDGKGLRLMALPGGEPDGQHDAVTVADQMDFRAEASLRAAQRMVLRLRHLHRFGAVQSRPLRGIFFSPRRLLARHG